MDWKIIEAYAPRFLNCRSSISCLVPDFCLCLDFKVEGNGLMISTLFYCPRLLLPQRFSLVVYHWRRHLQSIDFMFDRAIVHPQDCTCKYEFVKSFCSCHLTESLQFIENHVEKPWSIKALTRCMCR